MNKVLRKDLVETFLENKMKNKIPSMLKTIAQTYRPYDPGQYLYKLMFNTYKNHFNDNFIDLTYTTLIAWNMNQRGAKLSEYNEFKSSIKNNIRKLKELEVLSIEKNCMNDFVINKLRDLFNKLYLVKKDKPKLVTYSKTLHFLLPNLLMPIDRKYTLQFFYKNTDIPKENEIQFKMYCDIFMQFQNLAMSYDFNKFKDDNWNSSIPKIIDNLIIAYILEEKSNRA
jgi:hypothetical protein